MTSERYSLKTFGFTYLRALKKYLGIAFLICAAGILHMNRIFSVILQSRGASPEVMQAEKNARLFIFFDNSLNSGLTIIFFGLTWTVLAALLALFAYGFMLAPHSSNIRYSLGISRNSLFTARYLAVATVGFAGIFTSLLIVSAANAAFYGSSKELWITFAFLLFAHFTSFMFTFALTAIAVVLSGHLFEAIIYSAVLNYSPSLINISLSTLLTTMTKGSPIRYMPLYSDYCTYLDVHGNILAKTNEGLFNYSSLLLAGLDENVCFDFYRGDIFNMPDFGKIFVVFCVTALLAALACFFHSRRKVEIAGVMGSANLLEGWSVVTVGTALAATTGSIYYDLEPKFVKLITVISGIIIMAVGYTVVDLMFRRSFKEYKKNIWHLPLEICVFFMIIFATGVIMNHAYSRIPAAEKIASISVSLPSNLNSARYNNISYTAEDEKIAIIGILSDSSEEKTVYEVFETADEINLIRSVNDSLNKSDKPGSLNIYIEYKLKNGKSVRRIFDKARLENLQALYPLIQSENFHRKELIHFSRKSEEFYCPVFVSPNGSSTVIPAELYNDEFMQADLKKAIWSDIRDGNMPFFADGGRKLLGYIAYSDYDQADYDDYDDSDENEVNENGFTKLKRDSTINIGSFCDYSLIPVYEGMESTLSFLKKNGLDSYFKDKYDIVKISRCTYEEGEQYFSNNATGLLSASIYPKNYEFELTDAETDAVKLLKPDLPDNAEVFTGEKDIAELSEKIRLNCLADDDGYCVKAEYENGDYILAYIPGSAAG